MRSTTEGILQKRVTTKIPTIAVLLAAGIEPTLDAWLAFNETTDAFDAELLDILPVEFQEEYILRCKMNADLEKRWGVQQSRAEDYVEDGHLLA